MSKLYQAASIAALAVTLLTGTAVGQDLMTPPLTPPVLTQPMPSQGLVVPPRPALSPATNQVTGNATKAAEAQAAPQPVQSSPAPVERVSTTEQFEDWVVECFDPAFEGAACQATLRVVAGDASQVVMVFALTGSAGGPVAIQVALPLGISLDAAVQIVIGDGYQNKIAVSRCTPAGCIIEGTATDELIAALRLGRSGTIVVESETGEKIRLPFSLLGFTKAFERVLSGNG